MECVELLQVSSTPQRQVLAIYNRLTPLDFSRFPTVSLLFPYCSLPSLLQCARTGLQEGAVPIELVAEDLRWAGASLGRIGGSIDPEDILDAIFLEFCIGK